MKHAKYLKSDVYRRCEEVVKRGGGFLAMPEFFLYSASSEIAMQK
jgi:hypothetical protein